MGLIPSEIAMMEVIVADFSLHTSVALNHLVNENKIDLVAASASRASVFGFKSPDNYRSRKTEHCSALMVRKSLKSYAVEELHPMSWMNVLRFLKLKLGGFCGVDICTIRESGQFQILY